MRHWHTALVVQTKEWMFLFVWGGKGSLWILVYYCSCRLTLFLRCFS